MEVHKVELLVVDFDGLGADEIKRVLETTRYPNHCIYPDVLSTETREVEWSDSHPLNMTSTKEAECQRLFGT